VATDPRCFAARAIILADVPGVREDKDRRCVVLRVETTHLLVAYGQGSPSNTPARDVVVKQGSAFSRRYCVTKDTYFRPGNIEVIARSAVIKFFGIAPNDHLIEFNAFALAWKLAAAPLQTTTPAVAPVAAPPAIPTPSMPSMPRTTTPQQPAAVSLSPPPNNDRDR